MRSPLRVPTQLMPWDAQHRTCPQRGFLSTNHMPVPSIFLLETLVPVRVRIVRLRLPRRCANFRPCQDPHEVPQPTAGCKEAPQMEEGEASKEHNKLPKGPRSSHGGQN